MPSTNLLLCWCIAIWTQLGTMSSVLFYDRASEASLSSAPMPFYLVRMETLLVNELHGVVYSLMDVSMFWKVYVPLPAIGHNCCSWFNPFFHYIEQSFLLPVSTVAMKHLRESSSMPPKTHWPSTTLPRWYFLVSNFSFINLYHLPWTTNFLPSIEQRHRAYFTTKHVPVNCCVRAKSKLLLDLPLL